MGCTVFLIGKRQQVNLILIQQLTRKEMRLNCDTALIKWI